MALVKMICKILENLYVGGASDVPTAKKVGVNAVVNVAYDIDDSKYRNLYSESLYHFPMRDTDLDQTDMMIKARDTVIRLLSNGKIVYLHCAAGLSRSATVAILVLEKTNDMTFREAEDYVKSHNPGSRCGLNHMLLNRTIRGIRSRRECV